MPAKPMISGIVGFIAVAVGVIGFTQTWSEYQIAYAFQNGITGLEFLGAPFDHDKSGWAAVLMLIGLAGGAVSSAICFIKEGEDARVFLFLAFFAVLFGFMMVMDDIDAMPYYRGTGTVAGLGIWLEMAASILLFAAMLCPDPK